MAVNVMRSILEEKTSRIMEVMLSIASAKDMMSGEYLGACGAVGLTTGWNMVCHGRYLFGGALIALRH